MQRNAEKIERKRNSSQLCRPSASLCVAASLRQPYPFTNLHRVRREATEYTERYQRFMLCVLAVNSVNPP